MSFHQLLRGSCAVFLFKNVNGTGDGDKFHLYMQLIGADT